MVDYENRMIDSTVIKVYQHTNDLKMNGNSLRFILTVEIVL